jgi:hypothetical protein
VLQLGEAANRTRLARGAVLAGAALTLVGVVLPWVELRVFFGRLTVTGIDTNPGKLSLAAAIFAGLLVLVAASTADADARRVFQGLCLLPAVAIVFLAAFNLQDIDGLDTGTSAATADVGSGLWVTLVGGLVVMGGAVLALSVHPPEQTGDGPAPPFWFPGSVPPTGGR